MIRSKFKNTKQVTLLFILMFLLFSITGCAGFMPEATPLTTQEPDIIEPMEEVVISPERQSTEVELTLYFKHEFVDMLVPGSRLVQMENQTLEELVVEEVLKGPAKFGRVCVMPPNVKLMDVIRKDDTVFVNLNEAFKGTLDIRTLQGKQNIQDEHLPNLQAEIKRLAVYSIVNSLTEIPGVQQVKILVNNRSVTYDEIGLALLVPSVPNVTPDSLLIPLTRNSNLNLTPASTVNEFFLSLAAPFDWNRAYSLLATTNADGTARPPVETFEQMHTSYISEIVFEVREEEIRHDGTAFVTANFTVAYTSGEFREKVNYNLRVVNEDGVWRLVMPNFMIHPAN